MGHMSDRQKWESIDKSGNPYDGNLNPGSKSKPSIMMAKN